MAVTHILASVSAGISHYDDVIMDSIASQITSLTIVYSNVYSGADQSKHQSSASLAFVWGIHRGPVNSPHKWPVTRIMFPFDDVIMSNPQPYFISPIWGVYRPVTASSHTNLVSILPRSPVVSLQRTSNVDFWSFLAVGTNKLLNKR